MDIKTHLSLTVIATQLFSLFCPSSRLPYFPIEISRSAASCFPAYLTFLVGAATSTLYLPPFEPETVGIYIAWHGLMILAFFDDYYHHTMHMIGVYVMIIGCLVHLYCIRQLAVLWLVALLTFQMFLSRSIAIIDLQFHYDVFCWETWKKFFMDASFRSQLYETTKSILYYGKNGCKDNIFEFETISHMKHVAIYQWSILFVLFQAVI